MIVAQDIENAAGSAERLRDILGYSAEQEADPGLVAAIQFCVDEANEVLQRKLGMTFAPEEWDALTRAQKLPLVLNASRYAVLAAKMRGGKVIEQSEETEFQARQDNLEAISTQQDWPGLVRPLAQTKRRGGPIVRQSFDPTGFRR